MNNDSLAFGVGKGFGGTCFKPALIIYTGKEHRHTIVDRGHGVVWFGQYLYAFAAFDGDVARLETLAADARAEYLMLSIRFEKSAELAIFAASILGQIWDTR